MSGTGLRGHGHKLYKKVVLFSQTVVNDWNKLPANVTNSCNVNTFKNKLDC